MSLKQITRIAATRAALLWCLFLPANPVAALDVCDDLWFTRNLIFDRAGYCFGTVLGQTVFGNAGCTTKTPELTPQDKSVLDQIRGIEQDFACQVDTGRVVLNVEDLSFRKAMKDLPVTDGFESACVGWKGASFPLYDARNRAANVTGHVQTGDTLNWLFGDIDDWSFVTISVDGVTRAMGWSTQGTLQENICEFAAG